MAEEWDKYIVQDTSSTSNGDNWEQYAVKNNTTATPGADNSAVGAAVGIGAAGIGAYGLAKTGIPQAIGRGTASVGKGIVNLPTVVNTQKSDKFAKAIRSAFVQAHTDKVNKFGSQIDQLSVNNPTRTVSLQGVVDELNTNWGELTPEVKAVVKKTPYLNKMVGVKKPITTEIPLAKSQEIVNYMNTKVPKNIRYNNMDLIDTINSIRGSQLEAFPEMESVRAEYKAFIEPYNQVKSQFKFNKLLGSIKNKFGGAEGQAAVEQILPKETLKQIKGYRSGAKLAELPQDIPLIGRTLKTLGGMFGIAPQAMQAFGAWKAAKDRPNTTPEQELADMLYYSTTGNSLYQEQQRNKELLKKKNPTPAEKQQLVDMGLLL